MPASDTDAFGKNVCENEGEGSCCGTHGGGAPEIRQGVGYLDWGVKKFALFNFYSGTGLFSAINCGAKINPGPIPRFE